MRGVSFVTGVGLVSGVTNVSLVWTVVGVEVDALGLEGVVDSKERKAA